MLFGSIKKFESEDNYSSEMNVYSKLPFKLQSYYWLRIANCYLFINSGRLLNHMFESCLNNRAFKINHPSKIIDLYLSKNLLSLCLTSLLELKSGTYILASPLSTKLIGIKKHIDQYRNQSTLTNDRSFFS